MKTDSKENNPQNYILFIVFLILTAVVVILGFIYYRNFEEHYQHEVENQLTAIADLKVGEITQWRKERLGDGNIFYENEVFADHVKSYFKNQNDIDTKKRIHAWMEKVQSSYNYDGIFLIDPQFKMRIAIPEKYESSNIFISQNAIDSLISEKIYFKDFYRQESDHKIFLNVIVPILDKKNNNQLIAVIMMRIDPESFLYPLINNWPIPSKSAETLILRRDGHFAVFLNELKFQKNTALNLRIPLEKKDVAAVKAALGETGIVRGIDYRGMPIIAYVRSIPDSPWFMSARIDLSEVNAPLTEKRWTLAILVSVLVFGFGGVIGFISKQQSNRYHKARSFLAEELIITNNELHRLLLELKNAESVLRETNEYLENLFRYSNVPIIVWDVHYNITRFNPAFEVLTGRKADDVIGKSIKILFPANSVKSSMEFIRKAQSGERWEIVEINFLHADGSERILLWNSASVLSADNKTLIATIAQGQDITRRKQAEEEAKQEQTLSKAIIDSIPGTFYVLDENGLYIRWNAYQRDEIVGKPENLVAETNAADTIHPDDRAFVQSKIANVLLNDMDEIVESRVLLRGGPAFRWLVMTGRRIMIKGRPCLVGIGIDITERKHAEQALRDAKENLELLVLERTNELLKSKILLDESGRLARIGGWEIDLIKNELNWTDMMYIIHEIGPEFIPTVEGGVNFYTPEAKPVISEAVKMAIDIGQSFDVELQLITAKQNKIWVRAVGEAYKENGKIVKISGLFQDINERKLAEIEVFRKSEQFQLLANELEIIIDSIPGLVFYKDTNNRFIRVNKFMCDAYKMSKKQLEGTHLNDLHSLEQSQTYYDADLQVIRSRQPKINIDEPWETDAGIRWVNTSKIPFFDINGEVIGVIGVSIDVTERKLAEEELKKHREHLEVLVTERTTELDAAIENLEHSNKELEQFAYVASHDLQEPLRMVSSYTQLLASRYKDKLDQDANDFIQYAVDGANRMQKLINDLLDYSRISSRGQEFTIVDTSQILAQTILNLQERVNETNTSITNEDLPAVKADESQISRVFQNLIQNALKFTNKSEAPKIHISCKKKNDFYEFAVRDNGIGMDMQYHDRVFTIFQRLHSKREYPGTGIGLSICKRIIERHGGKIWFDSKENEGTTFYFTLSSLNT